MLCAGRFWQRAQQADASSSGLGQYLTETTGAELSPLLRRFLAATVTKYVRAHGSCLDRRSGQRGRLERLILVTNV